MCIKFGLLWGRGGQICTQEAILHRMVASKVDLRRCGQFLDFWKIEKCKFFRSSTSEAGLLSCTKSLVNKIFFKFSGISSKSCIFIDSSWLRTTFYIFWCMKNSIWQKKQKTQHKKSLFFIKIHQNKIRFQNKSLHFIKIH